MASALTQEQRAIDPIDLSVARLTVAWGVLFAVVHFYWAAGGSAAMDDGGASDAAEQASIAFGAFLAGVGLTLAEDPLRDRRPAAHPHRSDGPH
jgi:hypothetical protein